MENKKIFKTKHPKLPEFFNNFWSYAENNTLSANAKVLYMVLLNYTNKNHWNGAENIKLSNRKAMEQCSFTNTTTLVRAREELLKHELIFFDEGKRDQTPSKYKLRMKAKYKGYKPDYELPPVQKTQSNEYIHNLQEKTTDNLRPLNADVTTNELPPVQETTTNNLQSVIAEKEPSLDYLAENNELVTEQVTELLTNCHQSLPYNISSSSSSNNMNYPEYEKEDNMSKKIKLNSKSEKNEPEPIAEPIRAEFQLKYVGTVSNEPEPIKESITRYANEFLIEIQSMETLKEGDICWTTKEKQCYLKVLEKTKDVHGNLVMLIENQITGKSYYSQRDIEQFPVYVPIRKENESLSTLF